MEYLRGKSLVLLQYTVPYLLVFLYWVVKCRLMCFVHINIMFGFYYLTDLPINRTSARLFLYLTAE